MRWQLRALRHGEVACAGVLPGLLSLRPSHARSYRHKQRERKRNHGLVFECPYDNGFDILPRHAAACNGDHSRSRVSAKRRRAAGSRLVAGLYLWSFGEWLKRKRPAPMMSALRVFLGVSMGLMDRHNVRPIRTGNNYTLVAMVWVIGHVLAKTVRTRQGFSTAAKMMAASVSSTMQSPVCNRSSAPAALMLSGPART